MNRSLEDLRTFPMDVALGYRNDGFLGAWKALATRSVHRVIRTGRAVVLARPLDQEVEVLPPSGITIKTLTEGDWPALATLVARRDLKRFRALLANGRHCLVAWRGGQPAGYYWVAERIGPDVIVWPIPLELPEYAVYLCNQYVVPSERRKRIGSALHSAAVHTALQKGYREGWRMVGLSNGAALGAAQRGGSGLRIVGELRFVQLLSKTYARLTPAPAASAEIH